jgi:2-keto-4-pentenoate hydratase/2-oxohepta-3-ene-1,7-dioic acid hydratase in catechol pathway
MFSLATIRVGQQPTPAICIDGRYWALADVAPQLLQAMPGRGLMSVFADWPASEAVLIEVAKALAAGNARHAPLPAPSADGDILAPLLYPNKLILAGANYYDHMLIDGRRTSFDKTAYIPIFFLKPPTTTIVGSGATVHYPPVTEKFDYEVELCMVIGKRARSLTPGNAMDCVAGYTIAIDLSARDLQRNPRHLVNFDLFAGKCFDGGCPIGPGIVPARYVNPDDLKLRLWLNGELRQDSSTKQMIWSLTEQLVAISEFVTLEPGDIISTGTPAGTGLLNQAYMKAGDKMVAEIESLGRLSVEVLPAI